jgi:hypothetical protein
MDMTDRRCFPEILMGKDEGPALLKEDWPFFVPTLF